MSIDKITKTIELKVGNYVRTKKRGFQPSQIARIESISMKRDRCYHNQHYLELDHNLTPDYEFHIYEKDIEKSSPNIIDLIEEGDYVNGKKVCCFRKENCDYDIGFQYNDDFGEWYGIDADEIESIVTKEQMEGMQYVIK